MFTLGLGHLVWGFVGKQLQREKLWQEVPGTERGLNVDSGGQEQGRHGEGRKTAGVGAAGGGGRRMWDAWDAGDIPVEIPNGSLQAEQHGRSLKP